MGKRCRPGDGDGAAEVIYSDELTLRIFKGADGTVLFETSLSSCTWAEYAVAPAALVAPKPSNLTYEQAAAVPLSAFTALQGLRDHGRVGPGHRVLINGSTGAVGTFAVQIARALGAEVVAVCSARNVELVRSLGLGHRQ